MKKLVLKTVSDLRELYSLPFETLGECSWSPSPAPEVKLRAAVYQGGLLISLSCLGEVTRAVNFSDDYPVWEDNCLECFLSFDGKRYINLEANSCGALLAAAGTGREGRILLKNTDIPRPAVSCSVTEDCWEAVFTVYAETVTALRGSPLNPGDSLTANFYACADKAEKPYYAAWNPPLTPSPDFHRPEFFGTLTVE